MGNNESTPSRPTSNQSDSEDQETGFNWEKALETGLKIAAGAAVVGGAIALACSLLKESEKEEILFWKCAFKLIDEYGPTYSLLDQYEKEIERNQNAASKGGEKIRRLNWGNISELQINPQLRRFQSYMQAIQKLPGLVKQSKMSSIEFSKLLSHLEKIIESRKSDLDPNTNSYGNHENVIFLWENLRQEIENESNPSKSRSNQSDSGDQETGFNWTRALETGLTIAAGVAVVGGAIALACSLLKESEKEEILFWKCAFKLIDEYGPTYSLLDQYEKEIERNEHAASKGEEKIRRLHWGNIRELQINPHLSRFESYMQAIQKLPGLVKQSRMSSIEFSKLLGHLEKVIESRKSDLDPTTKSYENHKKIIVLWQTLREQLENLRF